MRLHPSAQRFDDKITASRDLLLSTTLGRVVFLATMAAFLATTVSAPWLSVNGWVGVPIVVALFFGLLFGAPTVDRFARRRRT